MSSSSFYNHPTHPTQITVEMDKIKLLGHQIVCKSYWILVMIINHNILFIISWKLVVTKRGSGLLHPEQTFESWLPLVFMHLSTGVKFSSSKATALSSSPSMNDVKLFFLYAMLTPSQFEKGSGGLFNSYFFTITWLISIMTPDQSIKSHSDSR